MAEAHMRAEGLRRLIIAVVAAITLAVAAPVAASAAGPPPQTFGSVEPIANPVVLDTRPLRERSLEVRAAFAQRLFDCGTVDRVVEVLTASGAIGTITPQNTSFAVTAGGFNGRTNPAYGYEITDSGPGSASHADIAVLTNALGYVFSQGSAFLLDGDDPTSFGFPANYVILRFPRTPTLRDSAALFETVGRIDPQLFATTSSGYTQFGPAYLSLQSNVSDQRFIDGYVAAAVEFGVEYKPVVDGVPGLFRGGADFPFNDWTSNPEGQQYLERIAVAAHDDLAEIRASVLRVTEHALQVVKRGPAGQAASERGLIRSLGNLPCRTPAAALAS
jgi:hypothetical protein